MENSSKKVTRLPSIFNSGEFFHENGMGFGAGEKRVVRMVSGKRTHNVDLVGNAVKWENNSSSWRTYEFESAEMAAAWWEEKFGKCEPFTFY